MKKIIYTHKAPNPIGPYSQANLINGTLYVSGQIALDPESGNLINESIQDEARQVMENLKAILFQAGMNFSNIVKASLFITNINDFKLINETYGSYFSGDYPAREVAEVGRLPLNSNLLISIIAFEK